MLKKVEHLSLEERTARGEAARDRVPPSSHTGWLPDPNRPNPVDLIEEQNTRRDADLVPVRHGRMMASPFTFYRGGAKIMAADLHGSPTAGLEVQLCGDAHLSNFGVFGSPERQLVFDINDFDETLPGPFEYDVKRLAASMTIAAFNNGFSKSDAKSVTRGTVMSYREAMGEFAKMRTLEVWYAHLSEDELRQATVREISALAAGRGHSDGEGKAAAKQAKKLKKRFEKNIGKAHTRDSLQALSKLTEVVDSRYRIASAPPVVVPARELDTTYGIDPEQLEGAILHAFSEYRRSLQPDRRKLLEKFEIVDWARKVVGVGSVGTRAFVALLEGRDHADPLFLQIKEATSSVLEGHLPKSRYRHSGERVVQGQRLMQASSDIFLGWSKGAEEGRYFYWRQLRDMKGSALVELMPPEALAFYGRLCGWTMARAHARSGDPVAIAAYLGADDAFDRSIADFSLRYSAQNERDFAAFTEAIRTSRLEAVPGV
ncbi:MAG TPA: DUF2252 domain-containing protein [Nocardioidaceae bacterium]|nr:DUF2252 domain-containing protein [Nocardioidaceae bacterium]